MGKKQWKSEGKAGENNKIVMKGEKKEKEKSKNVEKLLLKSTSKLNQTERNH